MHIQMNAELLRRDVVVQVQNIASADVVAVVARLRADSERLRHHHADVVPDAVRLKDARDGTVLGEWTL